MISCRRRGWGFWGRFCTGLLQSMRVNSHKTLKQWFFSMSILIWNVHICTTMKCFFFFFLNRTGTFINNLKPSPKANTTARRQTSNPKATNHARRPEVVNRDTESLTTKLGTNPSLKQLPKQQIKITRTYNRVLSIHWSTNQLKRESLV
jgi:hypothetical protein